MAEVHLTDTQGRIVFFQQCILKNLDYWRIWLANNLDDVSQVDDERGNVLKAISFALQLGEIAWPAARSLIETYSPYMERRGYWDEWSYILSEALQAAHKFQDQKTEVSLSLLMARLSFRQSQHKDAVKFYRHTIRIGCRIGDLFNSARAYTNLGFYFAERGYWYRAEILCCHALKLFEQVGSDYGRAHTENHLGYLYIWQKHWDQARYHLEQACALWQRINDTHGLMRGLINVGLLHNEMELPDQALPYLNEALHYTKQNGEEAEIAKIYINIAIAYRLKGEPIQAETYLLQAQTIFQRFSDLGGSVQVWGNLGMAYLDQKRWSEAKRCLEASLEIWRNLDNKDGQVKVLLEMVEYELAQGNEAEAQNLLKTAKTLIDKHNSNMQAYLQTLLQKFHRSVINEANQAAMK